jgi:hypothetical protein
LQEQPHSHLDIQKWAVLGKNVIYIKAKCQYQTRKQNSSNALLQTEMLVQPIEGLYIFLVKKNAPSGMPKLQKI